MSWLLAEPTSPSQIVRYSDAGVAQRAVGLSKAGGAVAVMPSVDGGGGYVAVGPPPDLPRSQRHTVDLLNPLTYVRVGSFQPGLGIIGLANYGQNLLVSFHESPGGNPELWWAAWFWTDAGTHTPTRSTTAALATTGIRPTDFQGFSRVQFSAFGGGDMWCGIQTASGGGHLRFWEVNHSPTPGQTYTTSPRLAANDFILPSEIDNPRGITVDNTGIIIANSGSSGSTIYRLTGVPPS